MNILITGGAGYIGSVTANYLIDNGHKIFLIDNLSTGNKRNIPKKCQFFKSNITNRKILSKIFKKNRIDIVLHFAAYIDVAESVKNPKKYFKNNYEKCKIFLSICKMNKVKNIVFSSTAAVYGNAKNKLISEKSTIRPISPYAKSKLKIENHLIKDNFFNFVILRYFNVAGADYKLRSGLISKKKSTHLIKKLCENFLKNKSISIFGNDYPSKDGTAIRDFIHVMDLADAHLKSAKYLLNKKKSLVLNCGYGNGYSVKQVIDTFNSLSKKKMLYNYKKRRSGDLFRLVADNKILKKKLNWKPKYNSLKKILKSSLDWEKKVNQYGK